ncbi:angiogenic factor with G patch and FHA domains 1 isoform X2 [Protopterus annectens]|nr:angiogenic factor with G patch and FHA domains 1 isoform X2 [Protopterus annectens]
MEEENSESELKCLQQKVQTLEEELKSCKVQLHNLEKQLSQSQRLYKSTESYNEDLRKQVERLSGEIHERKKKESKKSDAEVQTENATWTSADYYYYQNYYQSICQQSNTTDSTSETVNQSDVPNSDAGGHLQMDAYAQSKDSCAEEEESSNLVQTQEEPEGVSLAESLRATAEAAMSQTGFTYDETTGLYYDSSTGFYYDSENQLYYDPNTGIYYYLDSESGRYQFHSKVDLQAYQMCAEASADKKIKKKRKGTEKAATLEDKDVNTEEQEMDDSLSCQASVVESNGSVENEEQAGVNKRVKLDPENEDGSLTSDIENLNDREKLELADTDSISDGKSGVAEMQSEPEEGEIIDSEKEDLCSDDITSEEESEDTENQEVPVWPPCIRVMVIRSPVLQVGSLYIITAVKPATIGREKDMEHIIRIPELGVSKFHAEIFFDNELQHYVLVDQGSQNGTTINGKLILQPKTKSEPYKLEHGDEVKFGETVLSFHVHPGSDTCYGCEPGQVIAHLGLNKKEETPAQLLITKEDKEKTRRKKLKQMRVKYGLESSDYEESKSLKNPKYQDRAGARRETFGSEGVFQRDDAPASVHVEIDDTNKGRKMLEKMGWKKGEGLGKDSAGMKDPIKLHLRPKQAGLGAGLSMSVEDIQMDKRKNKNWEKARERYATEFQKDISERKDASKMSFVQGSTE